MVYISVVVDGHVNVYISVVVDGHVNKYC